MLQKDPQSTTIAAVHWTPDDKGKRVRPRATWRTVENEEWNESHVQQPWGRWLGWPRILEGRNFVAVVDVNDNDDDDDGYGDDDGTLDDKIKWFKPNLIDACAVSSN